MTIPETVIRRIAAEADADPRTVRKVLAGEPVRGVVRDRIVAVAAASSVKVPPAPPWRPPAVRSDLGR